MDIQTLIAELSARQQQQAAKNPVQTLLGQGKESGKGAGKDATAADDGKSAADPRTVNDTVTLSEGGQKVVNLARGFELAKEIRKAPVDKGFFANLGKALGDVFRIGRLFTETIKAAFAQSRK